MSNNILIFVPTYNEGENIGPLLRRILALELPADILVIDDNSADSTADVVLGIVGEFPQVSLQQRAGKLGIGSAHIAALRYSKANGCKTLITLDADFSHQPEDIPRFLALAESHDVVLGSRYVRSGSLSQWRIHRRLLTHFGHFLTKMLLSLPYDASGAFRLYRIDRIPESIINRFDSRDYEFFFESLTLLHVNGFRIGEVPIDLPARTYGHSKMQLRHIMRAVLRLGKLSVRLMTMRRHASKTANAVTRPDGGEMREAWDRYWAGKKTTIETSLYDRIAAFYRDYLIKPNLNRFIKGNFPPRSELLHAGCGGGQVDVDVVRYAKVTALDISPNALAKYRALHGDVVETVNGDIFDLKALNRKFDGIYNLGVMEHFEPEQIVALFKQFNASLKPNGRIVIFWPPVYGLSVIALHIIHFVLNNVLRRNVQLHPPEPTKASTYAEAARLLKLAGFKLTQMSFGPRDLFTYAVFVADKESEAI
jgi:dolichol-phosphate mannosyltransferase